MTADEPSTPPLLVIRGGASDAEIAAVVAVLQAVSASAPPATPRPRRRWGAPAHAVRHRHAAGLDGWRASSLPR